MVWAFGSASCRRIGGGPGLRTGLKPDLGSPLKRAGVYWGGLEPGVERPAYTKPKPPEGGWRGLARRHGAGQPARSDGRCGPPFTGLDGMGTGTQASRPGLSFGPALWAWRCAPSHTGSMAGGWLVGGWWYEARGGAGSERWRPVTCVPGSVAGVGGVARRSHTARGPSLRWWTRATRLGVRRRSNRT